MNDKEVRNMLEEEKIPEKLEPENIKIMLDEKAPAVKRKRISAVSRFAAVAAACAVVSGTAIHFAGKGNQPGSKGKSVQQASDGGAEPGKIDGGNSPAPAVQAPYMNGAKDYSEVYALMQSSYEKYQQNSEANYGAGMKFYAVDDMIEESNERDLSTSIKTADGDVPAINEDKPTAQNANEDEQHSDTFNQEENVLEADIVKTDGKTIYALSNEYYGRDNECRIKAVPVKDGSFGKVGYINITKTLKDLGADTSNMFIADVQLYLYNDMVIFTGYYQELTKTRLESKSSDYTVPKPKTVVLAFSTDDDHRLLGSYCQEGALNDVRISPDGYMYIISDYSSDNVMYIDDENKIKKYIPHTGTPDSMSPIEANDILMPESTGKPSMFLKYSVITSLDLNTSGSIAVSDTKALAGFAGQIYCSAGNLYTAVEDRYNELPEEVDYGYSEEMSTNTEITRIAIGGGKITPEASGSVPGTVNDQFSMSEYDGYFRVATTCEEYRITYKKGVHKNYFSTNAKGDTYRLNVPVTEEYGYYDYDNVKHDNRLYVLDLDLNTVGSIGDFGIDESVKSVNFNGDMAYVVTYEQTDPLFAIDLSTPDSPKILDEYKMLGYSSYMQNWDDGLLFGFGPDADARGVEIGVKMVMFDNSDPNELKQAGFYTMHESDDEWFYSVAVHDRKALLIAPEKNLIGFPIVKENYDVDKATDCICENTYKFFSYEDGKFIPKGDITEQLFYDDLRGDYFNTRGFERALYIGDYVFAVSDHSILSADIDTMTVKDIVDLKGVTIVSVDNNETGVKFINND
ncbi:MAG: beta-propeller domain-containing protein [Ruminococcus sp.]|nr:beta-propeller domain-containing protein [Ruminococcus sp.]